MAPRSWWTAAAFLLTGYVLSTCVAQNYRPNITREEREVRTVLANEFLLFANNSDDENMNYINQ